MSYIRIVSREKVVRELRVLDERNWIDLFDVDDDEWWRLFISLNFIQHDDVFIPFIFIFLFFVYYYYYYVSLIILWSSNFFYVFSKTFFGIFFPFWFSDFCQFFFILSFLIWFHCKYSLFLMCVRVLPYYSVCFFTLICLLSFTARLKQIFTEQN